MHSEVLRVTHNIAARSRTLRDQYRRDVDEMASEPINRSQLSCGNLAHGVASCGAEDKSTIKMMDSANIGIVSAYNDMLSAHAPYAGYPEQIKDALKAIGCTAQVAGGVPAMCDGVTQGQPGMELSLFSRDVIAQATAVSSVTPNVRCGIDAGHLRQDRTRIVDGCFAVWASADLVCTRRADDVRAF